MARILICDGLGPAGLEMLRSSGHEVDLLDPENRPRLVGLVADYESLIVRSATRVDRDLLTAGTKLIVVGRAGIGVDNIDIKAATERGILVVNAPTANALSATEHTLALLLATARRVAAADASLKAETWDRKSWVGQELYGKTLGIIGFGRIGQQVAERARAFQMRVVVHDPFLNPEIALDRGVEALQLDELLGRSNVVTFHTPLTEETRNLLNAERLALLPEGAIVINCGRGGVLDEDALLAALESGKVSAAGLDVFAKEPPSSFELAQHPRVVATPHIGAQTGEAQERIATETARMVCAALEGSLAVSAVNLPFRAEGGPGESYLRLTERLAHLAAAVLGPVGVSRLRVELWGLEDQRPEAFQAAAAKGALTPSQGAGVNYVNATELAAARGLDIELSNHSTKSDWAELIGVTLYGGEQQIQVAGTIYGRNDLRVVRYQGHDLEFSPEGRLLIFHNRDTPGVVGKIGQELGKAGVNIADIHLSQIGGHQAMAAVRLDQEPSEELLGRLRSIDEVDDCVSVSLEG